MLVFSFLTILAYLFVDPIPVDVMFYIVQFWFAMIDLLGKFMTLSFENIITFSLPQSICNDGCELKLFLSNTRGTVIQYV